MGISIFVVGVESAVGYSRLGELDMHKFPECREIKHWMKLSFILYKY